MTVAWMWSEAACTVLREIEWGGSEGQQVRGGRTSENLRVRQEQGEVVVMFCRVRRLR